MPNRGPKIAPAIRALIRHEALSDKRPRRIVAADLLKQIERLGVPVPGEETLLRLISEDRNSDHPEDQPWSLATLQEHPAVPPDALPSVLQAWAYAREHLEAAFTIREAKWAGCLSYVIKDIGTLAETAQSYARRELIAEIKGSREDSFEDDLKLLTVLTGQEISEERKARILGGPKYGWSRKDLAEVFRLIKQARNEIAREKEAK